MLPIQQCFGIAVMFMAAVVSAGEPANTAFTYQGQLKRYGVPLSDICDFRFSLWKTPDTRDPADQVGTTIAFDSTPATGDPIEIINGLFSVDLDFGGTAFDGNPRYLQISLNCPSDPGVLIYEILGRQRLTATPYALFAVNSGGSGGDGHSLDAADGLPVDALFVNGSGEVGIGTTSPLVPLHVVGNSIVDGDTLTTGIVGIGVLPQAQLHVLGRTILDGDLAVDRVGIGTRTPTEALTVRGVVDVSSTASALGKVRITRPNNDPGFVTVADNGNRRDIRFTDDGIALLTSSSNSIPGSTNGIRIDESGHVGIGTSAPAYPLHVKTNASRAIHGETSSTSGRGVFGAATSPTGFTYGGRFEASSTSGRAVFADAVAASGSTIGIQVRNRSDEGKAIFAQASATDGETIGGHFENASSSGRAVFAEATASEGLTTGIWTESASFAGTALLAIARSDVGVNRGVWGDTQSSNGYAGYFTGGRNYFGGDVGIGELDPTFQLHLSQNSAAKPTSNVWTISSDERLKKNIKPIKGALRDLLSLRGVTYQWRDPVSQGRMGGTYTGLIAQNVERVFPEWVGHDKAGYKTLTFIGFEGLVIEALRDLHEEKNQELERKQSQIDRLRRQLTDMQQRLARLERLQETRKDVR